MILIISFKDNNEKKMRSMQSMIICMINSYTNHSINDEFNSKNFLKSHKQ